MLKLEIRLVDERIIKDGKFTVKGIRKSLDESFFQYNLRKEMLEDGTICYMGNNHPHDYAHFGGLITDLKTKEWFLPYVDKWIWYNSNGQLDENCYRVEDILYHYTKQRSS